MPRPGTPRSDSPQPVARPRSGGDRCRAGRAWTGGQPLPGIDVRSEGSCPARGAATSRSPDSRRGGRNRRGRRDPSTGQVPRALRRSGGCRSATEAGSGITARPDRRFDHRRPGSDPCDDRDVVAWLRAEHRLDRLDLDLLLIALAPEVHLRYERLFGFLQDDLTRRRPSVDLALDLLCGSVVEKIQLQGRLSPDASLLRHGLISLETSGPGPQDAVAGPSPRPRRAGGAIPARRARTGPSARRCGRPGRATLRSPATVGLCRRRARSRTVRGGRIVGRRVGRAAEAVLSRIAPRRARAAPRRRSRRPGTSRSCGSISTERWPADPVPRSCGWRFGTRCSRMRSPTLRRSRPWATSDRRPAATSSLRWRLTPVRSSSAAQVSGRRHPTCRSAW